MVELDLIEGEYVVNEMYTGFIERTVEGYYIIIFNEQSLIISSLAEDPSGTKAVISVGLGYKQRSKRKLILVPSPRRRTG